MERSTMFTVMGKSTISTGPCSIAMLNYQRVYQVLSDYSWLYILYLYCILLYYVTLYILYSWLYQVLSYIHNLHLWLDSHPCHAGPGITVQVLKERPAALARGGPIRDIASWYIYIYIYIYQILYHIFGGTKRSKLGDHSEWDHHIKNI